MDMSRGTAVKLFGGWGSLSYHPGGQNHENTTKNKNHREKKKSEKNLVENDESS